MIKLNTPLGTIYIRKDAIIAISTTKEVGQNGTVVNSEIWVDGQEGAFNILEDVETIYNLLNNK